MQMTVIPGFKGSTQTELNAFFAPLANQADLTSKASAQAFSKALKHPSLYDCQSCRRNMKIDNVGILELTPTPQVLPNQQGAAKTGTALPPTTRLSW
jgi:hypothetical protein